MICEGWPVSTFAEAGTEKKYDVCEALERKEYAQQSPGIL
jgi:hypothetical protein